MVRAFPLVLFAVAAAVGQPVKDAGNPPPEVDKALRARITEFYDLQLKGSFRKAEALVAEEAKDPYYVMAKPKYNKLELAGIEYFDKFTRARATIKVERFIVAPPFPADVPVKGQMGSSWKLENGQWCWYIDAADLATPWNHGQTPALPPGGATAGVPGATPATLPPIPTSAGFALGKVKADKTAVEIARGSSARVAFHNNALGPMKLVIDHLPAGIEAKFDHAQMAAAAGAVLTLHAGKDAKPGTVDLRVEQTGEPLPIQVTLK
jgi:hypothetical protein